jgi:hypothetical protein
MIDNKCNKARDTIIESIKEKFPSHIVFLHNFNYGGTIVGLYNTYEYLKENKMDDWHIMYFEEDFYAKNIDFLEISIKLLDEVIYVGEITFSYKGIKTRNYNGKNQYWTDGGYYFSSYTKFNTMYNKIGPFHKGDPTTKYNQFNDGVLLGEVGFPTMLYDAGFRFIGLPRELYFIHNEHPH